MLVKLLHGPTDYAFVPALSGERTMGPQQNAKPSEAGPVTVQVGMEYCYRLRKGLDWERFWEFKGRCGGVGD